MVKVAKNLHQKSYSLREGGRVVGYATTLTLKNCTFEVHETTRQRVVRRKQKEVHAFVVGEQVPDSTVPTNAVPVTYNPYKAGHFYRKDTGEKVTRAREVHLTPDGVFGVEVD